MSNKEKKFWPMSRQQSFVASAAFLVVLFSIFFFNAVGKEILYWIKINSELATWIQGIGSLLVIYAMYFQTKKDIQERRRERELNEKKDYFKLMLFFRRKKLIYAYENLASAVKKYEDSAFSVEANLLCPSMFFLRMTNVSFESAYERFKEVSDEDMDRYSSIELISIEESMQQLIAFYQYFNGEMNSRVSYSFRKDSHGLNEADLARYERLEIKMNNLIEPIKFHVKKIDEINNKFVEVNKLNLNGL